MPLLDSYNSQASQKLKYNSVPFVSDWGERSLGNVLAEAYKQTSLSITFFKGTG